MKVCVLGPITTNSYYGGVAVFDEQLALGFYQAGHITSVVTYQTDANVDKLFGVIPVIKLFNKHSFSKWFEKEKPDLIIGSLDYPKIISRKIKAKTEIVYFLHGFFPAKYYGTIKSQLASFYQKMLIKNADLVFANSDFTSMINRDFYGISVDNVFRLGVADDFYKKTKNIKTIEKEKNTILYVGKVTESKGLGAVIQALKILNEKGKCCKLLVAGTGPEKERLEKYVIDNCLNVDFVGRVSHEDIDKYYKKAEIFVSLNPSEPFGITFAEALLSNCKIVCPSTGGQVEFLQKWVGSVSFVSWDSPMSIANGIEQLLSEGVLPNLDENEREIYTYKYIATQIIDSVFAKKN